jgi:1-acyl-sn-glycerol-3-phosphate acyltransferase
MIFPEGTRSMDGRMRPFKSGAFELALRTRAPILPIALDGTARALPKRGYLLRGHHPIRVRVLPEIDPASYSGETIDSLTARVRDCIARELPNESLPAAQTA